jgi:hypothetical protein
MYPATTLHGALTQKIMNSIFMATNTLNLAQLSFIKMGMSKRMVMLMQHAV